MEEKRFCICDTPVGPMRLEAGPEGLTGAAFLDDGAPTAPDGPVLEEAARQLAEYFRGARKVFDLPLRPIGTEFQLRVWRALREIPFGETRTYGDIARRLGRPGAARAVGMANHRNPLPVFIPCHRVVGANGALTGYAGGLMRKRALLQLERGE